MTMIRVACTDDNNDDTHALDFANHVGHLDYEAIMKAPKGRVGGTGKVLTKAQKDAAKKAAS